MAEFRMPSLGADMDEGTIVEWLVKPGDHIGKGDPIAVVDTAKAAVEVESFHTGVIDKLLVEPGQVAAVGTPLAIISDGEPHPVITSPLVRQMATRSGVDLGEVHGTGRDGAITRADVKEVVEHKAPPAKKPATRRRVSPRARKLAEQHGIDLSTVTGSGQEGSIRARDIPTATPTAAVTTPAPVRESTTMREAIAALMSRSKREIPHYYLSTTIDLGRAMAWLHEYNRSASIGSRLVPAALLLKATARAAHEVPQLNGFWRDNGFEPGHGVQLGVAVSLRGGGLVTPAIADACDLGLAPLMAALRELTGRARGGRLRLAELTSATITVTNLGDLGVESVFGVIFPPQVALVGFGAVVDRPAAVGGLLGIRPVVTATLSADHRASDGATGARFLNTIDRLLQEPEKL